jgi:hypothetical protein
MWASRRGRAKAARAAGCTRAGLAVVVLDSVAYSTVDGRSGRVDREASPPREPTLDRHEFFLHDGRTWFVQARTPVRRDESQTHVTLELISDRETRVVSCRREEWVGGSVDFANLLGRSVPAGASRDVNRHGDHHSGGRSA